MEQYPDDIVMQKEMSYVKPQEVQIYSCFRKYFQI